MAVPGSAASAAGAAAGPPRILHLLAAFEDDPAARRLVRLIEGFGRKAEHAIVADDRDRRGAARRLPRAAKISWPRFPPLTGSKLPGRLLKLAAAMRGYDLVCTWGAGALDAALAHTLFADVHKLAPLVHHELSADPADLGGRGRAWYRRFALGRTAALIVPTRALESLALREWDQPRTRVRLIPDGIDTRAFATMARRDQLPGLIKRKDELWLGTQAHAAGDEPLALVRALAKLAPGWQLVVAGEAAPPVEQGVERGVEQGVEQRAALEAEAVVLGIEDRLHFAGLVAERRQLLGLLDCLALPAPSSPDRTLVIEAMAAGLPVVAPRNAEAAAPLASANGPLLYDPDDPAGLGDALRQMAARADERRRIGQANRTRAREEFDEKRMVERSWALYGGLTGRAGRLATVDHAATAE